MYKGYTAGYHPASLIPAEINQLRLGNKTVTRSGEGAGISANLEAV